MKDLTFKYRVTGAHGFSSWQENGWENLSGDPVVAKEFGQFIQDGVALVKGFEGNGADDGLTLAVSVVIDGGTDGGVTVTGVSYKELSKFQLWLQRVSNTVVGWGQAMAEEKDRKRGWGGRGKHGERK